MGCLVSAVCVCNIVQEQGCKLLLKRILKRGHGWGSVGVECQPDEPRGFCEGHVSFLD